jgi:hypothetical protein
MSPSRSFSEIFITDIYLADSKHLAKHPPNSRIMGTYQVDS